MGRNGLKTTPCFARVYYECSVHEQLLTVGRCTALVVCITYGYTRHVAKREYCMIWCACALYKHYASVYMYEVRP